MTKFKYINIFMTTFFSFLANFKVLHGDLNSCQLYLVTIIKKLT